MPWSVRPTNSRQSPDTHRGSRWAPSASSAASGLCFWPQSSCEEKKTRADGSSFSLAIPPVGGRPAGDGGLAVGLVALFAVTAVATVLVGHTPRIHYTASAAIFFALSVCSGPALFLAIGVLTSQLAASRRQAAAYAAGALGVCFALRMAADSSNALSWLRWSSPLGWVDQLQPFTSPQPVALALILGLAAVLASLGIYLAGTRDLGASTLPDHASAKPHTALLFGPVGLTVRLIRSTVLGWLAGICAIGLLLGSVAKQAAKSLEASRSVESALSRLGGRGGEIRAYLGVSFLIIALLVALIAAGQITAMRREESGGLIEHLLVRPSPRPRWMAGRLGVAACAIVLGGSLAGVFAWLGVTAKA